jgi:Bacteriophage minor capsid protein
MSMKLKAVSEILHGQGIATFGVDLYIYSMPEGRNSGILLLDDPDTPTEVDEYIPKLKKSNFRAVIRGTSYEEAMNLAYLVRNALDVHGVTAANGIKFLRLKPTYDPIAYPLGEADIVEVSVNLWTAYIEP